MRQAEKRLVEEYMVNITRNLFHPPLPSSAFPHLFRLLRHTSLPCVPTGKNPAHMLLKCVWAGEEFECGKIFTPVPTDSGMCCAFNMDKAENIFRESKYESALSKFQEQDIQLGFDNSTLPSWYKESGEPKSQPGQNKGLMLILDAHTDRISPGTVYDNFRGFSTIVDGGEKYPLTQRNSLLVRPGRENYVAMSALQIDADENIVNIDPQKRYCYFPDEFSLEMHKSYSQSNCILECSMRYARDMMIKNQTDECSRYRINNQTKHEYTESNHYIEPKGCTPWFYPSTDEHYNNICDPWDTKLFQCYLTNVPDNKCTDICLLRLSDFEKSIQMSFSVKVNILY